MPLHQIEYLHRNVGNLNPESKVAVRWRYRNDEKNDTHVVLLTWSFHSGKQTVFVDGQECYFACEPGHSTINAKVADKEGTLIQVIGTRTRPAFAGPNFRCFDIVVDGQRYSEFLTADGSPAYKGANNYGAPTSVIDVLYPKKSQPHQQTPYGAPQSYTPAPHCAPAPMCAPPLPPQEVDLISFE